jgi:hypothetical protein
MRLRHDLMGCSSRMNQATSEFKTFLEEVREIWKDSRAERFEREDMRDIDTTIEGLVIVIQEACETLSGFDRQLKDDEVE